MVPANPARPASLQAQPRKKQKVFLVEDHPLMRRGMAALIAHHGDLEICGEAASPAEALQRLPAAAADLVIVDLILQDGDGLELIKQLTSQEYPGRILVCSMHDETIYAERALRAGARGYVNKAEPPEVLLAAIRCVLDGEVFVSPPMHARLLERMVASGGKEQRQLADSLSNRELAVLTALGQGRSTRQIADDLEVSVKTVETYRERIKAKLRLRTSHELMRFAVEWSLRSP